MIGKKSNNPDDDFDFDMGDDFFDLDDPFGSSSEAKPPKGIKGYLKNVGKSVKNIGVKLGKTYLPDVDYLIQDLKEDDDTNPTTKWTMAKVKKEVKSYSSTAADIAKDMAKDVKNSIKTGYFFKSEDDSFGDLDFGDGFGLDGGDSGLEEIADSGFGDSSVAPDASQNGDIDLIESSDSVESYNVKSAKAQTIANLRMHDDTINATLGATQAHIKAESSLFNQSLLVESEHHRQKMIVMKNIASNVGKIIQQNNVSIKAQMEYSLKSLAFAQDTAAMLKEVRDIQWKAYTPPKKDDTNNNSKFKKVFGNGFNKKEWFKNLKSRTVSDFGGGIFDMLGMVKDMLGGNEDLGLSPASLIKGMVGDQIFSTVADAVIPNTVRKNLDRLNTGIAGLPVAFNNFLGNIAENGFREDGMFRKFLDKIPLPQGLKDMALNQAQNFASYGYIEDTTKSNSGKYNLTPAEAERVHPFDGLAHYTLVNTIPKLLARIDAGVNNREEVVMDPSKGQLVSVSSVQRKVKQDQENALLYSEGYSYASDATKDRFTLANTGFAPVDKKKGIDTNAEYYVRDKDTNEFKSVGKIDKFDDDKQYFVKRKTNKNDEIVKSMNLSDAQIEQLNKNMMKNIYTSGVNLTEQNRKEFLNTKGDYELVYGENKARGPNPDVEYFTKDSNGKMTSVGKLDSFDPDKEYYYRPRELSNLNQKLGKNLTEGTGLDNLTDEQRDAIMATFMGGLDDFAKDENWTRFTQGRAKYIGNLNSTNSENEDRYGQMGMSLAFNSATNNAQNKIDIKNIRAKMTRVSDRMEQIRKDDPKNYLKNLAYKKAQSQYLDLSKQLKELEQYNDGVVDEVINAPKAPKLRTTDANFDQEKEWEIEELSDKSDNGILNNIYKLLLDGVIVYPRDKMDDKVAKRYETRNEVITKLKEERKNEIDADRLREESAKKESQLDAERRLQYRQDQLASYDIDSTLVRLAKEKNIPFVSKLILEGQKVAKGATEGLSTFLADNLEHYVYGKDIGGTETEETNKKLMAKLQSVGEQAKAEKDKLKEEAENNGIWSAIKMMVSDASKTELAQKGKDIGTNALNKGKDLLKSGKDNLVDIKNAFNEGGLSGAGNTILNKTKSTISNLTENIKNSSIYDKVSNYLKEESTNLENVLQDKAKTNKLVDKLLKNRDVTKEQIKEIKKTFEEQGSIEGFKLLENKIVNSSPVQRTLKLAEKGKKKVQEGIENLTNTETYNNIKNSKFGQFIDSSINFGKETLQKAKSALGSGLSKIKVGDTTLDQAIASIPNSELVTKLEAAKDPVDKAAILAKYSGNELNAFKDKINEFLNSQSKKGKKRHGIFKKLDELWNGKKHAEENFGEFKKEKSKIENDVKNKVSKEKVQQSSNNQKMDIENPEYLLKCTKTLYSDGFLTITEYNEIADTIIFKKDIKKAHNLIKKYINDKKTSDKKNIQKRKEEEQLANVDPKDFLDLIESSKTNGLLTSKQYKKLVELSVTNIKEAIKLAEKYISSSKVLTSKKISERDKIQVLNNTTVGAAQNIQKRKEEEPEKANLNPTEDKTKSVQASGEERREGSLKDQILDKKEEEEKKREEEKNEHLSSIAMILGNFFKNGFKLDKKTLDQIDESNQTAADKMSEAVENNSNEQASGWLGKIGEFIEKSPLGNTKFGKAVSSGLQKADGALGKVKNSKAGQWIRSKLGKTKLAGKISGLATTAGTGIASALGGKSAVRAFKKYGIKGLTKNLQKNIAKNGLKTFTKNVVKNAGKGSAELVGKGVGKATVGTLKGAGKAIKGATSIESHIWDALKKVKNVGSKVGDVAGKVTRGVFKGGKVAGKSALKTIADAGKAKGGLVKKFIDLLEKVGTSIFKNPKFGSGAKFFKTAFDALKSNISKIAGQIGSKITSAMAFLSSGWGALAKFAAGFTLGMTNTKKTLEIGKDMKPTAAMRLICAVAQGLDTLLSGIPTLLAKLIFKYKNFAAWLYSKVGSKAEKAALERYKKYCEMKAVIYGVKDSSALIAYENRNVVDKAGRAILNVVTFGIAKNNDDKDATLLGFKSAKIFKYWKEKKYDKLEEIRKTTAEDYGGLKVVEKTEKFTADKDNNGEIDEDEKEKAEKEQQAIANQQAFRVDFLKRARKWVIDNKLAWLNSDCTLENFKKRTGEEAKGIKSTKQRMKALGKKVGGAAKKALPYVAGFAAFGVGGAAIVGVVKNRKKIAEKSNAIIQDIKAGAVGKLLGKVGGAIGGFAKKAGGAIAETAKKAGAGIANVAKNVGAFIGNSFNAIKSGIKAVLDFAGKFIKNKAVQRVKGIIAVVNVIKSVCKAFTTLVSKDKSFANKLKTQLTIFTLALPMTITKAVTAFISGRLNPGKYLGFDVDQKTDKLRLIGSIIAVIKAVLPAADEACAQVFGKTLKRIVFDEVMNSSEKANTDTFFAQKAKILGLEVSNMLEYENKLNQDSFGKKAANFFKNMFGGGADRTDAKLCGFKSLEVFKFWREEKFDPLRNLEESVSRKFGDIDDLRSETPKDPEVQKKFRTAYLKEAKQYVKERGLEWLTYKTTEKELKERKKNKTLYLKSDKQYKKESAAQEESKNPFKKLKNFFFSKNADNRGNAKQSYQNNNTKYFSYSEIDAADTKAMEETLQKEYKYDKKAMSVMQQASASIKSFWKSISPNFYGDQAPAKVSADPKSTSDTVYYGKGGSDMSTGQGLVTKIRDRIVKPGKYFDLPQMTTKGIKDLTSMARTAGKNLKNKISLSDDGYGLNENKINRAQVMNSIVNDFAKNFGKELNKRLDILEEMHKESLRHNKVSEEFFVAALRLMQDIASKSGSGERISSSLDSAINALIH